MCSLRAGAVVDEAGYGVWVGDEERPGKGA